LQAGRRIARSEIAFRPDLPVYQPADISVAFAGTVDDIESSIAELKAGDNAMFPVGVDAEWIHPTMHPSSVLEVGAARKAKEVASVLSVSLPQRTFLFDVGMLSEHARDERVAELSEDLMRTIFSPARLAVIMFAGEGDIRMMNRTFSDLSLPSPVHPHSRRQIRTWAESIPPPSQDMVNLAHSVGIDASLIRNAAVTGPFQSHWVDFAPQWTRHFRESGRARWNGLIASRSSDKRPPQSLQDVVRTCLGEQLDKHWTLSNWDRRPLLPEQEQYAALDSRVLISIAQHVFAPQ